MYSDNITYKGRWLVLAASCLITLCIGSLYAWSAFATPMAKHLSSVLGYNVESLAIAFTVASSVGPVIMICGGFVTDKLGPKGVLYTGAVLFCAGMFLCGYARSVEMLVICYGIGVGFGDGLIYGVTTSNTVKFFPDKSGFAGGLITACYGLSSVIVPPIATSITINLGVTSAFKLIALVMFAVICVSSIFVRKCEAVEEHVSSENDCDYKQMVKTRAFYLMIFTLMCGAFSGTMIVSQASQIGQGMMGFGLEKAALCVSALALFNTMGRFLSGALSDRLGAPDTLRICALCLVLAGIMFALCSEKTSLLFYIAIAVMGTSFGGVMGTYPGFTARRFGRKNNSVNFGIMFLGFSLAAFFGPMAMDMIYKTTGRFQGAFLVSSVMAFIGFLLMTVYKKLEAKEK